MPMKRPFLLLISSLLLCNSACHTDANTAPEPEKATNTPTEQPPAKDRSGAKALYNEGYQAFRSDDYRKAIALYQQAITLDPDFTDAYDNCGLCYRRLGLLDSAKLYYRKSIALNPALVTAHINLGVVYMAEGQPDSALAEYREIIKYTPGEPESYYGMADVYLQTEEPDSALKYALKAIAQYKASTDRKQFTGDAEYYAGLAWYQKNNKEKARVYMQQALDHGAHVPEHFQALLGLQKAPANPAGQR